MITQCDKCKKKQDVPDVYRGRQIKCQHCKETITAHEYVPPPAPDIVAETIKVVKKHNPVRSAWNRMPKPFQIAFLSTLGVMSALLMTYFVYGKYLGLRGTESGALTLERAKTILAEKGLFHDGYLPEKGILRGRALTSMRFVPDANKSFPGLGLWIDGDSRVAGISADWNANVNGYPDISQNKSLDWRVSYSFDVLTEFNSLSIRELKFKKDEHNLEIATDQTSFGFIVVSRAPNLKDSRVYGFSVTAQSW